MITELGHASFALFGVIAKWEDYFGYTRPLLLWRKHLLDRTGMSVHPFLAARLRLEESGWLHCRPLPGFKQPTEYWILNPDIDKVGRNGPVLNVHVFTLSKSRDIQSRGVLNMHGYPIVEPTSDDQPPY